MRIDFKIGEKRYYFIIGIGKYKIESVGRPKESEHYTWEEIDSIRKQGLSWREIGELYPVSYQAIYDFWKRNSK